MGVFHTKDAIRTNPEATRRNREPSLTSTCDGHHVL